MFIASLVFSTNPLNTASNETSISPPVFQPISAQNLTHLGEEKHDVFMNFFGGSGMDYVECVITDKDGNLYLGGSTTSLDFPYTSPVVKNEKLYSRII